MFNLGKREGDEKTSTVSGEGVLKSVCDDRSGDSDTHLLTHFSQSPDEANYTLPLQIDTHFLTYSTIKTHTFKTQHQHENI